jgi:hypothetical protein
MGFHLYETGSATMWRAPFFVGVPAFQNRVRQLATDGSRTGRASRPSRARRAPVDLVDLQTGELCVDDLTERIRVLRTAKGDAVDEEGGRAGHAGGFSGRDVLVNKFPEATFRDADTQSIDIQLELATDFVEARGGKSPSPRKDRVVEVPEASLFVGT